MHLGEFVELVHLVAQQKYNSWYKLYYNSLRVFALSECFCHFGALSLNLN